MIGEEVYCKKNLTVSNNKGVIDSALAIPEVLYHPIVSSLLFLEEPFCSFTSLHRREKW